MIETELTELPAYGSVFELRFAAILVRVNAPITPESRTAVAILVTDAFSLRITFAEFALHIEAAGFSGILRVFCDADCRIRFTRQLFADAGFALMIRRAARIVRKFRGAAVHCGFGVIRVAKAIAARRIAGAHAHVPRAFAGSTLTVLLAARPKRERRAFAIVLLRERRVAFLARTVSVVVADAFLVLALARSAIRIFRARTTERCAQGSQEGFVSHPTR